MRPPQVGDTVLVRMRGMGAVPEPGKDLTPVRARVVQVHKQHRWYRVERERTVPDVFGLTRQVVCTECYKF